jgi:ribosomal protein S18 acetylase RimI-like enzyme
MIIRNAIFKDVPKLLPLMGLCKSEILTIFCHSRVGGNPVHARVSWISAFAEMTKILGFLQSLLVPKARIRIEGLVVDKKHRGQGIGKNLMFFVEDVAKKQDHVLVAPNIAPQQIIFPEKIC